VTAPVRFTCPAAVYYHPRDRHMVVDRRWTLIDPAGVETIVCSLACVITWACRRLPADVEAATEDASARTAGEAA
jgi:hypothetical protein